MHLTLITPAGKKILGLNWTPLLSNYRNKYYCKYFSGWLRTDQAGKAAGALEDLDPAQLHTPASEKHIL